MVYKNLIETAREEGIKSISVDALIQKDDGKILLVGGDPFYHFPSAMLRDEETLPQAIEQAVTENAMMEIKQVVRYLGHYDREGTRHFNFVVEVNDPYAAEEIEKSAYAWIDVQEAVGYPIWDELRAIIDFYKKS